MPKRRTKRDKFDEEADRYLDLPYTRILIPDAEDGGFFAEVMELPGCLTQGETPEETYANLQDAMGGWIAASLAAGHAIPKPMGLKEYSGKVPLRISSALHGAAAVRAMHEGISLNQWISLAVAEKVSGERAASAPVRYEASKRRKTRVADKSDS